MVDRVVFPVWYGPEPQIPIQRVGHLVFVVDVSQLIDPAVAESGLHGMDFSDLPNRSRPYALAKLANRFERMALVPELGRHFVPARSLGHLPHFIDRSR